MCRALVLLTAISLFAREAFAAETALNGPTPAQRLRTILDQNNLELSSEPSSARLHSQFLIAVERKVEDGSILGYKAFVRQDGDQASVLVVSLKNSFVCYSTQGLVVTFDPQKRKLVGFRGGRLDCIYATDSKDGQISQQLPLVRADGPPRVKLALGDLAAGALSHASNTDFDPTQGVFTCRTAHTLVRIRLKGATEAIPVALAEMGVKSQDDVIISARVLEQSPVTELSEQDLAQLGVEFAPIAAAPEPLIDLRRIAENDSAPGIADALHQFLELTKRVNAREASDKQGKLLKDIACFYADRAEAILNRLSVDGERRKRAHEALASQKQRAEDALPQLRDGKLTWENFASRSLQFGEPASALQRILEADEFRRWQEQWKSSAGNDVRAFDAIFAPPRRQAFNAVQRNAAQEKQFEMALAKYREEFAAIVAADPAATEDRAELRRRTALSDETFQSAVRSILGDGDFEKYKLALSQSEPNDAATQPSPADPTVVRPGSLSG